MKNAYFRLMLATLTVSLIILTGCGRTVPTRFYILSPLSDSDIEGHPPGVKRGLGIGLGIGPVDLPDYLERPQIVTRTRQNKLNLADFDKWAGSLRHDIPRVLSENLSLLLATNRVFLFPWKDAAPVRYQIAVNIIRFDAKSGEEAILNARWTILGKKGRKVLRMQKSAIQKPIYGQDYEAIVSAQSQALGELSRDIAGVIKALSGR